MEPEAHRLEGAGDAAPEPEGIAELLFEGPWRGGKQGNVLVAGTDEALDARPSRRLKV